MLLDVAALGFDSFTASDRLLARGRIAATPMRHWGEVNGDRFMRFVFSNEPLARLAGAGGARAARPRGRRDDFRFPRSFGSAPGCSIAAGIWYLYLGARGALDGSTVWAPLVIVGVAAVAVGTSLLRWFRRADD